MPLISIIIPVGPGHAQHLRTALASCLWQTFPDWEAIVVNDSPERLPRFDDERIGIIEAGGGLGAAAARNLGLYSSVGTFVLPLDADDYLLRGGLEWLIRRHVLHDAAYTYAEHIIRQRDGSYVHQRPPLYQQALYERFNLHPITALVPRSAAIDVGGFDEGAPGWEDWTFYLRLALAGHCGHAEPGPVLVYQVDEGYQHHKDLAGGVGLMEQIRERHRTNGKMEFAMCGCNKGAAAARDAAQAAVLKMAQAGAGSDLLMEYLGSNTGSIRFTHPTSRRVYRVGANAANRFVLVHPEDVEWLAGVVSLRNVNGLPTMEAPPAPIEPAQEVADGTTATPPETTEVPEVVAQDTTAESHAPAVDSATARTRRKPR